MKKLKPSTVIPTIKPTNSNFKNEIVKYMVLKDFWSYMFYPIPETWNENLYKFEFLKYQGKNSVFLDYEFENHFHEPKQRQIYNKVLFVFNERYFADYILPELLGIW